MYVLRFKGRTNLLKVSVVAVAAMLAACFVALEVRIGPSQAAFPGQNGKIAFTRLQHDHNWEIYTVNPDGSGETNISNEQGTDSWPAWSPDGTKIAFTSLRSGTDSFYDIYVMNADGSNQTRLTDHVGFIRDEAPAWSPDGTKIAFVSDRDDPTSDSNIYVMNADGSNQTRLTSDPDWDFNPAWSPDGTKIAFERAVSECFTCANYEIYTMNADGSNQTRLTNNPAEDFAPAWSPDGTKIAFDSGRDLNSEIYVMNPDGSDPTNLTKTPSFNEVDPHFSPDGQKIAFMNRHIRWGWNDCPGLCDSAIFVMNADGSEVTRLTTNPDPAPGYSSGLDVMPDWQPLPAPATKAECKNGGYEQFGFNTQGQCIASVRRAAKSE